MIQPRSHLTIVDNSGARYAQCIRVLKKKNAQVGDLIIVSLKKIKVSQSQKLKVKKRTSLQSFTFTYKNSS